MEFIEILGIITTATLSVLGWLGVKMSKLTDTLIDLNKTIVIINERTDAHKTDIQRNSDDIRTLFRHHEEVAKTVSNIEVRCDINGHR